MTITHFIEIDFRHEVDHWITIKSIVKLSKLQEILIQTNVGSMEYAIAYEKRMNYLEYLKSPSGRYFLT